MSRIDQLAKNKMATSSLQHDFVRRRLRSSQQLWTQRRSNLKLITRNQLWPLVFVLLAFVPAHADAAFFLEEPYGKMGAMDPTGHAAVY